jgi:pimeloyl-ACP methyl ester carboxylesterase
MTRRPVAVICLTALVCAGGCRSDQAPASSARAVRAGTDLEHEVRGDGPPLLFLHGAFIEHALLPLAGEPALDGRRRIRLHRRGYGDSARHDGAFSLAGEARDALELLQALDVERADVVGYSSGGLVALELALLAPDVVRSLVLIEPAIDAAVAPNPATPPFLAAAIDLYASGDKAAAANAFQEARLGSAWRDELPTMLPHGVAQVERNTDVFFQLELPAVMSYRFTRERSAGIGQPILLVLSEEGAQRAYPGILREWLPHTEVFLVPDANHDLPWKQPRAIAARIATFLMTR